MEPLKLFWPHPKVEFNGRGISEYWLEAMEQLGFKGTQDYAEADMVFFISDSQLKAEYIGDKPTVGYFWGWPPERCLTAGFPEWATERLNLLGHCTRVLVPGPLTFAQLCDFGISSMVCLPGVDTKMLDTAPSSTEVKSQVIFVSRLAPQKRLDLLIEALGLLDPKPPLIVVGPGDPGLKSQYAALAQARGVTATFMEPDDYEKARLIKESAVLVHPSEYEGFGLGPMEALYLGVPVIATDIPQMRWLLQEYANYTSSIEGLADQIAAVINDRVAALAKAKAGQEFVKKNYTIQKAAAGLWAHLHQAHKEFWGAKIHADPHSKELIAKAYEAEHIRNWAYGWGPEEWNGPLRFDPTWSRHFRAQFFLEELKKTQAHKIADIGCGPVYPCIFAMHGFEVSAFDVSQEALNQAQTIADKWGVGGKITTHQGYAQELPFESETFDAVVEGEIWEHVPSIRPLVAEALRVLKPGGILIASSPIGSHHFDAHHIASEGGGWSEATLREALLPWTKNIVKITQIAEVGTDPSCFLILLKKELADGGKALDEGTSGNPEHLLGSS